MDTGRKIKIEEMIRESAARYIERESNKTTLITVTRVELYERGRRATIYCTVMPVENENDALHFLKRQRSEIRDEIKRNLNIHTIPFLEIEIDNGEKARQTIDALLKE
jgi:ribosome-binding factor A